MSMEEQVFTVFNHFFVSFFISKDESHTLTDHQVSPFTNSSVKDIPLFLEYTWTQLVSLNLQSFSLLFIAAKKCIAFQLY
jgi:hypothetical protein